MKNNILLVDMDNFFCSIEEIRHPELVGQPIVIGGKNKKGVVSSCNKISKDMGIKAGMPIFKVLEICPYITILNSDIPYYSMISSMIDNILRKFTYKIEKSSIDEWYIDLNDKKDFFNRNIEEIANTIRYKIFNELKLKCSVGISYNKFLAKLACEFAKPNNIFILDQTNFKEYIWPMEIHDMYMVGKKSSLLMKELGINTIKDLANFKDLNLLKSKFGKMANYYYNCANGIDDSPVDYKRKIKSIGHSTKYENDLYYESNFYKEINDHFDKCYKRLMDNKLYTNHITVGIGYKQNKKTKSKKLLNYYNDKQLLQNTVFSLFNKISNIEKFDYISINFGNVLNKYQLDSNYKLFEKDETNFIDKINKKFNQEVIKYAKDK